LEQPRDFGGKYLSEFGPAPWLASPCRLFLPRPFLLTIPGQNVALTQHVDASAL